MRKLPYKCYHCDKEHEISLREDCDGDVIITVCPETKKGVYLEE